MKKAFIFFSLFLFTLYSCSEQEELDVMIIEFGTTCGWCAGQEYIKVSSTKVEYSRNIPCGENKGMTHKDKNLTKSEWNDIKGSFDYNLFLTLIHDECNVCADGCDEHLKITKDGNEHLLSYSPSTEIEGMGNLLEKLNNLMSEFRD